VTNACPAKFALGQVVITRSALNYAEMYAVDPLGLVRRHQASDWGDLGSHDKALNDAAVVHGGRILSVYEMAGKRWYVITEADRSVTTIMLTSDY
jgi:hypothetical protein